MRVSSTGCVLLVAYTISAFCLLHAIMCTLAGKPTYIHYYNCHGGVCRLHVSVSSAAEALPIS